MILPFEAVNLLWVVAIFAIVGICAAPTSKKSVVTLIAVLITASVTSIFAVSALAGRTVEFSVEAGRLFGSILFRIDSLSAWFILIINITMISGAIYGIGYTRPYQNDKAKLNLHWSMYLLFHLSMLWVSMVQHSIGFLVAWELMSLSSLLLVMFEHEKTQTLKAGLNYMVQMHISVAFLTAAFIWVYAKTGSMSMDAIADFYGVNGNLWLFLVFFIGFGLKAGFIPLHSWLPYAHPAAPSHVSGVMSGVIVKMGIYGILRMASYLTGEYVLIGEIVLSVSVLTGIYGITNASVQRDVKRMLAYCTIENIGLIGIGIGIGLIGIRSNNPYMQLFGFTGALLHTLNHSLFKSLLFFGAGSIYQQTHTRNIDQMGGLIKKMPKSALFFLIGALAIGGLPPFNGFISEFLIYSGLFKGMVSSENASQVILLILSIAGLAIIGGISVLTFTKTFGVIFLGSPREELEHKPQESKFIMLLPQYIIVAVMLSIAFVPHFYFSLTSSITGQLFTISELTDSNFISPMIRNMKFIGLFSLIFLLTISAVYGLRVFFTRRREENYYHTWGCGYVGDVPKAQYTSTSFSRPFGQLFGFVVREKKNFNRIDKQKIFPGKRSFSTHYFDLFERFFIVPSTKILSRFLNYFQFIQNGQIQLYVIYGLVFIALIFIGSIFNLIG